MTLANKITIFRILLVPGIVVLLAADLNLAAFAAFLSALLTDWLDGTIARKRNEVSTLGQALDPVADKMLFLFVFGYFGISGRIPLEAFLLMMIPSLFLLLGGLLFYKKEGIVIEAKSLGKISTLILSFGLSLVFLRIKFAVWVLYGGIATSYLAAIHYVFLASRLTGAEKN